MESTNEFLKEKIKKLPQELIANTHFNEEDMNRRLVNYRKKNNEDSNINMFFAEKNIPIKKILLSSENDKEDTFLEIMEFIEKVEFLIFK